MTICYVRLDVAISGLKLKSEAEMEKLREQIQEVIENAHPEGISNILDDDVQVEITEHAGNCQGHIE